jgi:hypothetical protein
MYIYMYKHTYIYEALHIFIDIYTYTYLYSLLPSHISVMLRSLFWIRLLSSTTSSLPLSAPPFNMKENLQHEMCLKLIVPHNMILLDAWISCKETLGNTAYGQDHLRRFSKHLKKHLDMSQL